MLVTKCAWYKVERVFRTIELNACIKWNAKNEIHSMKWKEGTTKNAMHIIKYIK